MAFGIKRKELVTWKKRVKNGDIAILTHYWDDPRFPGCTTVTKIGCNDMDKLKRWGEQYQLKSDWIHENAYPHFDVFGDKQKEILLNEKMNKQIKRFKL